MKVELHCHSDGLVDGPMLRTLLSRGLVQGVDPAALDALVPVRSLATWQADYGPIARACAVSPAALMAIVGIHVERLRAQRVVYAELMVSGLLDPSGPEGPVIERFEALRDVATRAGDGETRIELLVAIGRGPAARVERQSERILALARHGLIVGVAIAGNEAACSCRSLTSFLGRFRDAGLGIEIHAGETEGPASVWDAIDNGVQPDRLGHAVHAFDDPRLVDEIHRRDLHIEFCITSNMRLGIVSDPTQHPIERAHERGMSFSINTDDPGPFGCSMGSECELLAKTFKFTETDFERIHANAWRARFKR